MPQIGDGPRSAVAFAARMGSLRASWLAERRTAPGDSADLIRLAEGSPHIGDIPSEQIAEFAAQAARKDPSVLGYGAPEGAQDLRALLAEFAERSGDGPVAPEQVIVTNGATQALDLLATILLDPGDVVVVESPTFPDALATFSAHDATVVEVPADQHGIVADEIPPLIRRVGRPPKMVYVIPTFHNPTGVTTSERRRAELAEVAAAYGTILVEDDPYRLLRFHGEPLTPLRRLGDESRTVAIRSASKLIAPGLRVGWALAPRSVVAKMAEAKQIRDLGTAGLNQQIVAGFLGGGLRKSHRAHHCGISSASRGDPRRV